MRFIVLIVAAFQFLMSACSQESYSGSTLQRRSRNPMKQVSMNDIAVLYPLPRAESEIEFLIPLAGKGARGDLLPMRAWKKFPILRSGMQRAEIFKELRVVGLRFDPCFREGNPHKLGPPCNPQIRLVAQPVIPKEFQRDTTTRDAAVHLFYSLSAQEIESLLKEVVELTSSYRNLIEGRPLDVHPVLAREGLDGPFARRLNKMVLDKIGEENLVRVTFMTLAGSFDNQWTFGGFDITPTDEKVILIGGNTFFRQTITTNTDFPIPLMSTIVPQSKDDDTLLDAFGMAPALLRRPLSEQRNATSKLHRVENPNFHNPATVDCVSCHIATISKAWARENELPGADRNKYTFESRYPLENKSTVNPRKAVLRAFGYFDSEPAISQRVINECAAILASFNAR